jgi:hypothetical protein
VAHAFQEVCNRGVAAQIHMRPRADILRFVDGFELVDPGLVYVYPWRPDSPDDIPADPSESANLAGVGAVG